MHNQGRKSYSPQSRATPGNDRVIPVRQLLAEGKEVRLEHDGAIYLLRITRNGKLILTK